MQFLLLTWFSGISSSIVRLNSTTAPNQQPGCLQDFGITGKFRNEKIKGYGSREIESNESTGVDWNGAKKTRRGG